MTSYMLRHLPKAPPQRYWVTGNYLLDYRSERFGIGAALHAILIGDETTDLPIIFFLRLEQEALGRHTGQHTVSGTHPPNNTLKSFSFYFQPNSCTSKRVD